MGMQQLEATVLGRVQGVSFRHYTGLQANRLGLTGYVKNQRNGSVYVIAEGETAVLEQFLAYLHDGSPMARVDAVNSRWLPATGQYKQFQVRWF